MVNFGSGQSASMETKIIIVFQLHCFFKVLLFQGYSNTREVLQKKLEFPLAPDIITNVREDKDAMPTLPLHLPNLSLTE